MYWIILILLFILSANGIVIPTVAWVLTWVCLGLTIVKEIADSIEKSRDKDSNKKKRY